MRLAASFAAIFALASCATHDMADEAVQPPFDPAACTARAFSIYFESWHADLSEEARTAILDQQRALAGCRIEHVRIVGMAGAPGDEAANQAISQQRAEVIANALAAGGWPREHFELVAIGEAGASAPDGMDLPMRRRVNVSVEASAP